MNLFQQPGFCNKFVTKKGGLTDSRFATKSTKDTKGDGEYSQGSRGWGEVVERRIVLFSCNRSYMNDF